MHLDSFDSLIPHMKRAGFIATATSAVITAQFGWSTGENVLSGAALAILLALATFIVGYALVAANEAFRRRMWGISAAATALCLIGVVVEFTTHTGFTAANRDSNILTASHQTEIAKDNRDLIASLKAEVASLEQQRGMTPTRTIGQAQAVIDSAMAHKWWTATSECKAPKGPQTRAWCDAYRAAVADVDGWKIGADREEKIAAVRAKLITAQKESAVTQVSHASSASQGIILAKAITRDLNPSKDAQGWALIGLSSLLAIFAIAAGALLNLIAFGFDGPSDKPARTATAEPEAITDTVEQVRRFVRGAGRSVVNITAPVMDDRLRGDLRKALA